MCTNAKVQKMHAKLRNMHVQKYKSVKKHVRKLHVQKCKSAKNACRKMQKCKGAFAKDANVQKMHPKKSTLCVI
jgi:hypothetical protein